MSQPFTPRRTLPLDGVLLAAAIAVLAVFGTPAHASSTQVLHVSASKSMLRFNTTRLSAHAGRVEIVLSNPSHIMHGIGISGNGVHAVSKLASPGKSVSVTATLKKGTYTFYCPVAGHEMAGMKGTLSVS